MSKTGLISVKVFIQAYDGFAHVVDATRSKKYFLD